MYVCIFMLLSMQYATCHMPHALRICHMPCAMCNLQYVYVVFDMWCVYAICCMRHAICELGTYTLSRTRTHIYFATCLAAHNVYLSCRRCRPTCVGNHDPIPPEFGYNANPWFCSMHCTGSMHTHTLHETWQCWFGPLQCVCVCEIYFPNGIGTLQRVLGYCRICLSTTSCNGCGQLPFRCRLTSASPVRLCILCAKTVS